MKVAMNSFATRHWTESGFTKTTLSPDALVELVEANFTNATQGYRDGVILVSVDPSTFSTPVRKLREGDELSVKFTARRENELAVISVGHHAEYTKADMAQVVLYRSDVLGDDASTDAEWEVISLNASVDSIGECPMTPVAMARNFLGLEGGTKATYSADEFAKAIMFWATHAMGV